MKKALIALVALFLSAHILRAQEKIATIRMLPEDVVQTSIRLVPNGHTNEISVWWTYTEAGARKMLAFWEEHVGQRAATQVGDWTTPVGIVEPPADPKAYIAWRQAWLHRRTDKFFSVSLEDAKKIVEGLKK